MKILPNTLVKFQADYIDDDGKPTKTRYHLVIKVDKIKREVILLKITSRWKSFFWQGKLGSVKCLTKTSFVIYNRIIFFDLDSLKFNNPRKFWICSIHRSGCLEKKRFVKIVQKLENF